MEAEAEGRAEGRAEGMERGVEIGTREGRMEAIRATVRRLLCRGGYSDAEIAEIAGTDEAEVRAVAASLPSALA